MKVQAQTNWTMTFQAQTNWMMMVQAQMNARYYYCHLCYHQTCDWDDQTLLSGDQTLTTAGKLTRRSGVAQPGLETQTENLIYI